MEQSAVNKIKNVVIVGGGTAGWITASFLVKMLGRTLNITLVESDDIGTIGVGEATIPAIMQFNKALGLDEKRFIRETKGTIKLGIQFENWNREGDKYMHAFGGIGKNFPFCDFHHFWNRGQQQGLTFDYWDFSLNYQSAIANKFAHLDRIPSLQLPGLEYAFHFDAGLYAAFLRRYSESLGVKRIEGKITRVHQHEQSGHVSAVELASGSLIAGDLFVDCSGLRGLLIEQTLNTGYEDWSHWLPADRAFAVPCERVDPITPYTRAIAHKTGWQWRIPLQHRIGNGIVYSSKYLSDDEATSMLLSNLDGEALAEPRQVRFKTGRRRQQWNRNVVSIGLSSGFLEPLESTSIHLIQSGVIRLVKLFPHLGITTQLRDEYNRQSKLEFEQIRDFIILHYKLNSRGDSPFWRDCQRMDIPETLARKIRLFDETGQVFRDSDELFSEIAWQQVFIGQGMIPKDYHPLVDALSKQQLAEMLADLKTVIQGTAAKVGPHDSYLASCLNPV